jgi:hypothetical protein
VTTADGQLFGAVLARGRVADAVGDSAWLQAMLDAPLTAPAAAGREGAK